MPTPNEAAKIMCPDCEGTGIVIDIVATCCNRPDEYGNCCNFPEPGQVQAQCERCEATGYVKSEIELL